MKQVKIFDLKFKKSELIFFKKTQKKFLGVF